MHLYTTELICSTGVSGFQICKLVFYSIHNKLSLHAEILSYLVNNVTFPYIQPSEFRSVSFERE